MVEIKVGIVGFGNVGQDLANRLLNGVIDGVRLVAVSSRDVAKCREHARALGLDVRVLGLEEVVDASDVVVECATAPAMMEIAIATLRKGRDLVCISAGGLSDTTQLEALARQGGGRVRIANGAIPSLDILRAASFSDVQSVHMISVIRPESLFGEATAIKLGFDFQASYPSSKTKVYEGTAREAARDFPRHMNIALSLSIGGIGLDRTTLELWVDPALPGANNTVLIKSPIATVTSTIQNIPSKANKKTSAIVVPSILSALKAYVAPITAGA